MSPVSLIKDFPANLWQTVLLYSSISTLLQINESKYFNKKNKSFVFLKKILEQNSQYEFDDDKISSMKCTELIRLSKYLFSPKIYNFIHLFSGVENTNIKNFILEYDILNNFRPHKTYVIQPKDFMYFKSLENIFEEEKKISEDNITLNLKEWKIIKYHPNNDVSHGEVIGKETFFNHLNTHFDFFRWKHFLKEHNICICGGSVNSLVQKNSRFNRHEQDIDLFVYGSNDLSRIKLFDIMSLFSKLYELIF